MIHFDKNTVPDRIILSRKGFDSSSGGCCASPIFEDGRMLSMPIHEHPLRKTSRYGEIPTPSIPFFPTLGAVAEALPGCLMEGCNHAHLDPDIQPGMRPHGADQRFGLFGQSGASQTGLKNDEVKENDLFLFFGWFRRVKRVDDSLQWVPKAPDLHVIWGWLQISSVVNLPENLPVTQEVKQIAGHHPHATGLDRQNNALYLSEPGKTLAGFGVFPTYKQALQLTAKDSSRSRWSLPPWFGAARTFNTAAAIDEGISGNLLLTHIGQKQEFVFPTKNNKDAAAAWLNATFAALETP